MVEEKVENFFPSGKHNKDKDETFPYFDVAFKYDSSLARIGPTHKYPTEEKSIRIFTGFIDLLPSGKHDLLTEF